MATRARSRDFLPCGHSGGQDVRDVGDVVEKFTATPRVPGATSPNGASSLEWGPPSTSADFRGDLPHWILWTVADVSLRHCSCVASFLSRNHFPDRCNRRIGKRWRSASGRHWSSAYWWSSRALSTSASLKRRSRGHRHSKGGAPLWSL